MTNTNADFAGYSIFAHSRPDKIGTPRLLPLYIRNILNGISAKNPLKYYALQLAGCPTIQIFDVRCQYVVAATFRLRIIYAG